MTSPGDERRPSRRRLHWAAALLAVAILVSLPRIWRIVLAGLLVADAFQPSGPALLARVSAEPQRVLTRSPGRNGPRPSDLYLPAGRQAVRAVLLVHGVNETGKDDPRIVALASNLARLRSAVLVPDFPALRRLEVSSADIVDVILGYEDLLRRFDSLCRFDEGYACGIISFSYGAGPSLVAAADSRVRERVGFVVSFGGYADLAEVIRFVTTGRASDNRVKVAPYPWAKWAFLAANASLVEDESDRALLKRIARARLGGASDDVVPIAAALGPEGHSVLALVTNEDPDRTADLIAALSPKLRAALAALSPLSSIDAIRARLLLAHGMGDRSIPFTESERLAAAAPGRSRLTLTRLFGHVDPAELADSGPSSLAAAAADGWRLVLFADDLLAHAR